MHALKSGNFCKDRLCPVCSYRNARRTAYKMMELLMVTKSFYNYKFLFLTVTAPNVLGDELKKEIDNFQESWKRFSNNRVFKKICKGFIRKLEITYNKKTNTYHPHYHILITVNSGYFSNSYISRNKWLEMWQQAKRDDSITQIDVRRAKFDNIKSIYELATYSSKVKDVLKNGKDVFNIFYDSLRRRRLITYNGCFKNLKAKIDAGEIDLSQIPELDKVKILLDHEINFEWEKYEYIQKEFLKLPKEEQKEFYSFFQQLDKQ